MKICGTWRGQIGEEPKEQECRCWGGYALNFQNRSGDSRREELPENPALVALDWASLFQERTLFCSELKKNERESWGFWEVCELL